MPTSKIMSPGRRLRALIASCMLTLPVWQPLQALRYTCIGLPASAVEGTLPAHISILPHERFSLPGRTPVPTSLILDSLVRSVQAGSLYALMALGLTLTMAVLRLPNFAHAELVTIGAYVALLVSVALTNSVPVILVMAFLGSALVALLAHRVVYRPLARLNLSTYAMIL